MSTRSTCSVQRLATSSATLARVLAWRSGALLCTLCFAMSASAGAITAMQARRIVVVSSDDAPMLKTALAGIERGSAGIPVKTFAADPASAQAVSAALAATSHDTALIALGNRASELTERYARAIPGARAVHCLVERAIPASLGSHAPLVPLEVPSDQHLEWLRVLLPKAKRVGILFDAIPNEHRATDLAHVLQAAGYEPVLAPVTGPTSLPSALALLTGVDALHALPGPTVMAGTSTRGLLLFSFRHRIPLIGPNVASVRSGALYALERNIEATGDYCAALALSRFVPFRTSPPATLPQPRPRVSVNLRTAERFELRWSPELLRTLEPVAP